MRIVAIVFSVLNLAACGGSSSAITQVSESPLGAFEASLAAYPDGFIAAWYDTRDGHGEIYARQIDADGTPQGREHRLTAGVNDAYEADVQSAGDGFVVGWYEKAADGRLTPKVGAWSRDGTPRWSKTPSARGRNTVVRAGNGLVFAAWIQDEEESRAGVWTAWWRSDGTDLIAPRRLADAGRTTWNLNAALDPASAPDRPRAWVVFDALAGTKSEELFLVADAGPAGQRVVQLTTDDGVASKYPDLAVTADRAAIVWFDMRDGNEEVYLQVTAAHALDAAPATAPVRVTFTPGDSIGAYLAWNGDRLGVAWCDDDVGQHEIFFQAFDSDGRPERDAVRLTETPTSSLIPAIKPWKRGFALVWGEYEPQAGEGHGEGGRSQIAFTVVP